MRDMSPDETPFADRPRSLRGILRPLGRALALVWLADRRVAVAMACITLLLGALPVGQAWVAKLIIDGVSDALTRQAPTEMAFRGVLPYILWEFGFLLVGSVLGQLRRLLDEILDHKIGFLINARIVRKALRLDLRYFEDAEFYDRMQNARRQSDYRAMAIVKAVFALCGHAITLASFLALLVSFSPYVALVLFGAALPAFLAQTRYSELDFRLQSWKAPETRRMAYLERLLTVDSSVKEIKLFGLGEPLLARYTALFWKVFREDARLAWRRSGASLGWGLVGTLSYYGCYAWVVWRTVAGAIGLGSMTLYLSIFRQSQMTFTGLFESLNGLYENGLFMENLFGFLDLPEAAPTRGVSLAPLDPADGIRIEGVSFRYPGQTAWALRDIRLHLAPGEKLALVGENGSGKTTLIKLLTRLYEPTQGRITFQGRDLRDWDPDALRLHIGVIFQDFVRYQLTARENVGFGAVEALEDASRLARAAHKGGAQAVIDALEGGWETTLGGWFERGRELSGGQWQKVALSRAFMREGDVIVLDEPTSALDAEREYEIFQRFKDLTAGNMAILISHRFSTVRMADRIAVLQRGGLLELGTHAELLARGGTYARLFELQAAGNR